MSSTDTSIDPSVPDARPSIYGMRPDDLVAHLESLGHTLALPDARRLCARTISRKPGGPPSRRTVSKRAERLVDEHVRSDRLEVVERVNSDEDGFLKYLFRSPDGALSEAVRIPLKKPGHFSVCLSSQVGCAMQCVFCATGRLGLSRNLAPWEIVAAFLTVRDEAPGRVTGAVFQGQGEPFHNYDAVIQAARVLSDPCGACVDGRNITISTVGLVPQIRRYAAEKHQYRLIISLTSAISEKRRQLLPVAGRFSLEDVAGAIREYAAVARGRVTVAWVLMGGVNHDASEVDELTRLLTGLPLRINIIDVNDARPDGFRRATDDERHEFLDRLQVLKAPIVRRYSGGASKHAACGMLAATHSNAADMTIV